MGRLPRFVPEAAAYGPGTVRAMAAHTGGTETKRFGRSAGLLSAGVGSAGLLTYLYFALASHNLGPTEYGQIVVLWSLVFVTISVAHRPVEQLLSRSIAERRARGLPFGSALRVAGVIELGVIAALTLLALALREPLTDDLLRGAEDLYWVLVFAVIAFGASFFARGVLAGNHRFGLLAGLLVCESASRTGFALAVALGIAEGQTAIALGIAAAPLFSLLVVPLAFGRRVAQASPAPVELPEGDGGGLSLSRGGGFAGAVLIVMLSEQALLNAGPLLTSAFVDAAAAGFVFNVLLLARAPLVVFQGVAVSLLPHLTRLRSQGSAMEGEFRGSVRVTLMAVGAFTALVAAVVAAAGPELMQVAFGDEFPYERGELLLITAGMGLYLTATTLNQAILAQGGAARAAARWAVCAIAFVVWCALPLVGDEVRRVELGFTGAASLLAALLTLAYRSAGPEGGLEPGSPDELEARLASADEAS